jgi:hypothetical protein
MIKEFINTFKELKEEYLPNLTKRHVFFGVLVFFLFLSVFTSAGVSLHIRNETDNTSTKIEYIELGEKSIIKQKETIYIDDKDLSNIKFNSAIDSRCPEGTHCIVAGEITYKMHYNNRNIDEDFIVSTVKNKEVIVNGYKIKVTSGEKKYIELIIEKVPENNNDSE